MGSFNTACFVSNQIIAPGAHALIFPLSQATSYDPVKLSFNGKNFSQHSFCSNSCYDTAFWNYAGPLISGVYDDYGCFELDNTPENYTNLVCFFNILDKISLATHQGKNTIHDVAFDIHNIYQPEAHYSFAQLVDIWEKVWDTAQENRLFIMSKDTPQPMSFAVMHEASAQYLIDTVSKLKSYDKKSLAMLPYFKNYLDDKWILIKQYLSHTDEKSMAGLYLFLFSFTTYGVGSNEGSFIQRFYEEGYEEIEGSQRFLKTYEPALALMKEFHTQNPKAQTVSDELAQAVLNTIKTHIHHRYIHAGLNYHQLKLSPMIYGSQDYNNQMGRNYKKLVNAVSALVNLDIRSEAE